MMEHKAYEVFRGKRIGSTCRVDCYRRTRDMLCVACATDPCTYATTCERMNGSREREREVNWQRPNTLYIYFFLFDEICPSWLLECLSTYFFSWMRLCISSRLLFKALSLSLLFYILFWDSTHSSSLVLNWSGQFKRVLFSFLYKYIRNNSLTLCYNNNMISHLKLYCRI